VLEDGRVTPLGADQYETEVDVFIIAATNRGLPERIRNGEFRADLYRRLATLRIHVPPLRERKDNITLTVAQRLELLKQEGYDRKLKKSEEKALLDYDWPGNVRQLIKLLEGTILLDMTMQEAIDEEKELGELVEDADGRASGDALLPASKSEVMTIEELHRLYGRRTWELHENYTAAAEALKARKGKARGSKDGRLGSCASSSGTGIPNNSNCCLSCGRRGPCGN